MLISAFKFQNYRRFYAGTAISNAGNWTHRLAQDWLVLQLTGSATALGIVVAAQFIPGIFFGVYGGVLADKFDQRKVLLGCYGAGAILASALGAFVYLDLVTYGIVVVAAFLLGIATAIEGPVRQSYYVMLVGDEHLPNALSWNQVNLYFGRLVGPLTAGVLIETIGMAPSFFFNGFTYLLAVLAIVAINVNNYELATTKAQPGESETLVSALRYLRTNKEVLLAISIVSFAAMMGQDMQVTSALMASQEFKGNAASLGLLGSLVAAGAIVGSVAFTRKKFALDLAFISRRVIYVSMVWYLASLAPTYATYAIALFLVGYFAMGVNISGNMSIRVFVDARFYGKVWGIYIALWLTAIAMGGPILGLISENFSIRAAIASGAIASAAVALLTLIALKLGLIQRSGVNSRK